MNKILIAFILLCTSILTYGQKTIPSAPAGEPIYTTFEKLTPLPTSNGINAPKPANYKPLPFNFTKGLKDVEITAVGKNGLPTFIKAQFDLDQNLSQTNKIFAYLDKLKKVMHIENPSQEFSLLSSTEDQLGNKHFKFEQTYRGVKVQGGQIIVHEYDGKLSAVNGQYLATPKDFDINPTIAQNQSRSIVQTHLSQKTNNYEMNADQLRLIDGEPYTSVLSIQSLDFKNINNVLTYYIEVYPNVAEKFAYVVNATTGEIMDHYSLLCKFAHNHGSSNASCTSVMPPPPSVSNGTDLSGTPRTFNTFSSGGQHHMVDATRDMYNAGQSNMPDEPVGVIWTIDAFNTSPQNNNFNYDHVKSSSTNWSNKAIAISAHYNAGKAYDYFKITHNRNSINGAGGNIISIINVSESNGSSMDNAFWNGQAMFYGNGNQAFSPLAEALDVAGHELTHGVVQKTANLAYQGESGAINESFADIFGAMIDRDDWKMGEDIVNSSAFPSGALRDLQNPHNGGNSLSDPGYQPENTSEQYMGSQDNGGVHINSGIPNKAYYLLATSIGKNKAELIYYHALTNYLTMSSQFLDLRAAVTESTTQLYGNTELNAVNNAFNTVMIGSSGGTTTGETYQVDIDPNPGDEFIIAVPTNNIDIDLYDGIGNWLSTLTNETVISKPSITDDGTAIVFIAGDKTMHAIFIDWGANSFQEQILNAQPVWRNVVVAKDGSRIAALVDQTENKVHVYDFTLENWAEFELYNPTFSTGQTTGDVLYADVLEFDISGKNVVYDAFNEINGTNGSIDYWDVSFINVFGSTDFSQGDISKLFSQLPENASIGNPTFSKNSPYILAFDYFENNNNVYEVLAANLETGDVGLIFENSRLGFPNYNKLDNKMIFEAETQGGDVVLALIDVTSNKIEANGNAAVHIDNAKWGSFIANGVRSLDVNNDNVIIDNTLLTILPNPIKDQLNATYSSEISSKGQIDIYTIDGKLIYTEALKINEGNNTFSISANNWNQGLYKLILSTENTVSTQSVVKQ